MPKTHRPTRRGLGPVVAADLIRPMVVSLYAPLPEGLRDEDAPKLLGQPHPPLLEGLAWSLAFKEVGFDALYLHPNWVDLALRHAGAEYLRRVTYVLNQYHRRSEVLGLLDPATPARKAADQVLKRLWDGQTPTWDQLFAVRRNVPMKGKDAWAPNSEGLSQELNHWYELKWHLKQRPQLNELHLIKTRIARCLNPRLVRVTEPLKEAA